VGRVVASVRRRVESLQAWVERTIFWRVWERMLENEFVDRSVALAAKAFVSLFPAIIVVAAFVPSSVRESIYSTIRNRAGLSGAGADTFKSAFATSNDVRKATGILGLIFTFFYINSFVTALQRVYTRAWRRPAGGRVSGYALGAAWLVALLAYAAMLGGARAALGNHAPVIALAPVALAATIALWIITPWFLLQRQVRFRALVPTGIITGVAVGVYAATASIWMPTTVTKNQQQFGFFGVALSLVTWLTGIGTIIVIGACAGTVLAEDEGRLGRLTRGSDAQSVLVDGAAPSLAPPLRSPTIGRALGLPRRDDTVDVDLTDEVAPVEQPT
jgi:membrane protein